MILHELLGNENHEIYRELETSNGNRHYDFLRSAINASLSIDRPFLSQTIIKALNFQAITCLHVHAGEYRPCPVQVGNYRPPEHYRVQALMDDFVNQVNLIWTSTDPVVLAAYVLWRINFIHPFINGNGRTARAAAYFVLCTRNGGLLPGNNILPELLRENRDEYIECIREADRSLESGPVDLTSLHNLISRLLEDQLGDVGEEGSAASPDDSDE